MIMISLALITHILIMRKGIANLSIGKVDRIWSFSEKSSLILSSNSRPLEALSLKLEE